jgi:hypothetical protein
MALGVTIGMLGTVRAQMHLREILAAPGIQAKILLPGGNEILIGAANQKFDEQTGQLLNLFGTLYMRKSNDCRKFYQSLLFSLPLHGCSFGLFLFMQEML